VRIVTISAIHDYALPAPSTHPFAVRSTGPISGLLEVAASAEPVDVVETHGRAIL
jgi:hypothetical protein